MKKMMIPLTDRPTKPITIRMPVDVLEDLKRVAPTRDLPGYQSLIKFYVRQGLRLYLEGLWEMEEKGYSLFRVGNLSGTLVGQGTASMCRAGVKDKTFGCFASLTPALSHMLCVKQADGGGMASTSDKGMWTEKC